MRTGRPNDIVRWAEKGGVHTAQWVERVLSSRPHPQLGYRACLGVMRLGRRHGFDRLDAACKRALVLNALSYRKRRINLGARTGKPAPAGNDLGGARHRTRQPARSRLLSPIQPFHERRTCTVADQSHHATPDGTQAQRHAQSLPRTTRITPGPDALTFEERFGLLVDREHAERYNRSFTARLRAARLRLPATLEDVDYRQPRGLDKRQLLALASGEWMSRHHNCIITGPTGAGKTYLACALAHQVCREGWTVRYHRLPRLFQELALAKGDGRYPKLNESIGQG